MSEVNQSVRDAERARCIVQALEAAMESGQQVASISFDGFSATYRSLDEMRRAHAYWRRIAGRTDGTRPVVSTINAY